jgi:tRNA nucleotidyltransferase/poly(A) polymerase
MNIPQDIKDIHQIMTAAGHQLFVVGGCVRDHLLGSNIKDYDMATDAMPEKISELLKDNYRLDYTGKSFGVIRVYTKDCPKGYEIATFREDVSVGRQPEVRLGATIEENVLRRDFTINALFYDLDKCEIIDLVGGVEDVENRVLRCVGNPVDRFNEDRLRVLRAIRFALRFGMKIHEDTAEAIMKCRVLEGPDKDGNTVPIVRERINEEMFKAFEQLNSPLMYFTLLQEYGLLYQVMPGYYYPEQWINTRTPEVLVASLFHASDTSRQMLTRKLKEEIKLPNKFVDGVELLLDAAKYVEHATDELHTFAFTIAKRRERLELADADLTVFLHWVMSKEEKRRNANALALSVYKLSVTGQSLLDEGMKEGPEMGEEQRRREAIKFNQLLQQCDRVVRDK